MGKEIERKFLVTDDSFRSLAEGIYCRQGYLSSNKERIVRVRTTGNSGFLTIKGITIGAARSEYEYEIPVEDAEAMLDALCEKPLIEKNRFKIPYEGLIWEVDEFLGENQGLILAEVELESENQHIHKPQWIGKEVTENSKYFNSNLAKNPYKNWKRK
jgi:CYTH domain-containing protein